MGRLMVWSVLLRVCRVVNNREQGLVTGRVINRQVFCVEVLQLSLTEQHDLNNTTVMEVATSSNPVPAEF